MSAVHHTFAIAAGALIGLAIGIEFNGSLSSLPGLASVADLGARLKIQNAAPVPIPAPVAKPVQTSSVQSAENAAISAAASAGINKLSDWLGGLDY